jgi:L-histidine N-alpha-methyltransferase
VRAYVADYFDVLDSAKLELGQRVLAMFMGSNIGNYNPAEADALLTRIAQRLRPGDGLLLGADSIKDSATLEAAYDDPAGVTAAFDKNILGRINREFGGTFDLRNFTHVAVYDDVRHCVDSYLEAKRAHRVSIAALSRGSANSGLEIAFAQGERIHTESSYKFDRETIERMASNAGFQLSKMWTDDAKRFGVYLLSR